MTNMESFYVLSSIWYLKHNLADKCITRFNGNKLRLDKFELKLRHTLFTVRVINHQNSLLMEKVDSPSLEASKSKWDAFPKVML